MWQKYTTWCAPVCGCLCVVAMKFTGCQIWAVRLSMAQAVRLGSGGCNEAAMSPEPGPRLWSRPQRPLMASPRLPASRTLDRGTINRLWHLTDRYVACFVTIPSTPRQPRHIDAWHHMYCQPHMHKNKVWIIALFAILLLFIIFSTLLEISWM